MFFYGEFVVGLMSILSFFSGGAGLPLGVPPEPDPFMQKVAPDECLAYISWAGMKKPDPESENTTEALLAEAEVQRIIAEVDRRLIDALTAAEEDAADSPQAVLAEQGVSLARPLLMRPTAIFIESLEMGERGPDVRGGALVNLGEDADQVRTALEKLQAQFAKDAKVEQVEVAGTPAQRITFDGPAPEITWAIKGVYLIVGVGPESFEGMLARVKTDPPEWLAQQLHRSDVGRVSSIIYVDLKNSIDSVLPFAGREADEIRFGLRAMGWENAQSLCVVSGLDSKGFVSNAHLQIEGEALGLMTFVSDRPLTPLDMHDIPADATLAVAARADADEIYARFKSVVGEFEPGGPDEIDREMRRIEEQTGLRIFDGIFPGLGDVWIAYNSPSEGGLIATGLTAAVTVKDEKKLRPEFDRLMELMRDEFARVRGFRGGRGASLKEMEFDGQTIHYIAGEDDLWVAPSFCMTDTHVIFALFPQNVKAFLSHGDDLESLATSPHVGPRMKMQGGPSVIVYQDTKRLFKLLYPLAPLFGQMMSRELSYSDMDFDISLLPSVGAVAKHLNPGLMTIARDRDGVTMESRQSLPGGVAGVATPLMLGMYARSIKDARLSARRAQSINNLRQIALALHHYHDVNGRFPPAYSVDKEGKPLLSWRVHILPYVEEDALYEEFRLDEPWNSEHNRKLIARMPTFFRSPTSQAAEGKTVYLGVRGENSILSGAKRGDELEKVTMDDVRDGLPNTIMTLEVSDEKAVEWSRPEDFAYDPEDPQAGLVGQHKAGFLAAFGDGSVQFLSRHIDGATLLNVFNRRDANVTRIERFRVGRRSRRHYGHALGHAAPAAEAHAVEAALHDDVPHGHGEVAEEARPTLEAPEARPRAEDGAKVEGRVTLDGEPLAGAAIRFYRGDAKRPVAVGVTGEDGSFELRAVGGGPLSAGKYRVAIAKTQTIERDGEPPSVELLTPKRYASPETSRLQMEVVRGDNVFNFELTGD